MQKLWVAMSWLSNIMLGIAFLFFFAWFANYGGLFWGPELQKHLAPTGWGMVFCSILAAGAEEVFRPGDKKPLS